MPYIRSVLLSYELLSLFPLTRSILLLQSQKRQEVLCRKGRCSTSAPTRLQCKARHRQHHQQTAAKCTHDALSGPANYSAVTCSHRPDPTQVKPLNILQFSLRQNCVALMVRAEKENGGIARSVSSELEHPNNLKPALKPEGSPLSIFSFCRASVRA